MNDRHDSADHFAADVLEAVFNDDLKAFNALHTTADEWHLAALVLASALKHTINQAIEQANFNDEEQRQYEMALLHKIRHQGVLTAVYAHTNIL